jgi:hypothetical protein
MKTQIIAGLVAAALVGLSVASADAVTKPVSLPQIKSTVEKAACRGGFKDYADCLRVVNHSQYCNKACS